MVQVAASSPEAFMEALLMAPGLGPPPGVLPNFDNPYSFKNYALFTLILFLTISTFLVTLRIYTRCVITKTTGYEDWTCLIALIVFAAYSGIGLVFQKGSCVHQWNVRLIDVIEFGRVANAGTTVYTINQLFIKVSILQQYLHIFVPSRNKLYYLTHFIIWFNVLFQLSIALVTIFQCTPREKIWKPFLPGKCINFDAVLVVGGSINIASDFAILALPIGSVWRLQMVRKRKIAVSAVFAVGLFACIASIVRLERSVHMIHSQDLTYDLMVVYLWTIAEIGSGILCACFPVMPQFFRHFGPKITSSLKMGYKRRSSPSGSNGLEYPARGSNNLGSSEGARPEVRKGLYVELDEVNGSRLDDAGKTQMGYENTSEAIGGDGNFERGGAGLGGIRKTTTVEQYRC